MLLGIYISAQATSNNGSVNNGWLMIEDFENYNVDDILYFHNYWGGAASGGSATVAANPTDANDKVAHIVTTSSNNENGILAIPVTLPFGKVLADYDEISFDLYRSSNDEDLKELVIYARLERIFGDDGNLINQAPVEVWTRKTYPIDSDISVDDSFTLRLGIRTNAGDYYINNVALKERGFSTNISDIKVTREELAVVKSVVTSDNITNFKVYSTNGTLIISKNNSYSVDLSSLSDGVYIVKSSHAVIKVVK